MVILDFFLTFFGTPPPYYLVCFSSGPPLIALPTTVGKIP